MFNSTFAYIPSWDHPKSKPTKDTQQVSAIFICYTLHYEWNIPRSVNLFIHFDYRNKRLRLRHGRCAILYLSHRFVTICFVTNNCAWWNPTVTSVRVRLWLWWETVGLQQITVCLCSSLHFRRPQQFALCPVQECSVSHLTTHTEWSQRNMNQSPHLQQSTGEFSYFHN